MIDSFIEMRGLGSTSSSYRMFPAGATQGGTSIQKQARLGIEPGGKAEIIATIRITAFGASGVTV
jgi:hypothetical protein